jgi:leader peptidase (prepilin peptidase)/N-methyltransferase
MDFALAAPFGLVIGSFLNVVAYRLPRGESLVTPASRCTTCGEAVKPWDNVPVLSWLMLRGRCRGCGERISAHYPLVELMTGLVFAAVVLVNGLDTELVALSVLAFGLTADGLVAAAFCVVLVAVSVIDLEHRIIPNRIVVPMAVYGVVATAAVKTDFLPEALIAGAAAFTFMLVIALAHPKGMGMGDVKLAGVMGVFLGLSVAPALLLGFLSGSLVGVAVMMKHGAAGRKRGVPFAPFLALGGLVALLVGPDLVALYADNFL